MIYKKFLIVIILFITTSISFAQDSPFYSDNYGLLMWLQSQRPTADSLNKNIRIIDSMMAYLDNKIFSGKFIVGADAAGLNSVPIALIANTDTNPFSFVATNAHAIGSGAYSLAFATTNITGIPTFNILKMHVEVFRIVEDGANPIAIRNPIVTVDNTGASRGFTVGIFSDDETTPIDQDDEFYLAVYLD